MHIPISFIISFQYEALEFFKSELWIVSLNVRIFNKKNVFCNFCLDNAIYICRINKQKRPKHLEILNTIKKKSDQRAINYSGHLVYLYWKQNIGKKEINANNLISVNSEFIWTMWKALHGILHWFTNVEITMFIS